MERDALIEEVREARREISRKCGHDIRKLYARYQAMQKRLKAQGHKFISQPFSGEALEVQPAPARRSRVA